jgi:pimeloyl-ACP methyl ester carboxylesterase
MSKATGNRVTAEEFDVQASAGRIHAERFGSKGAALVLALPGLSANMKSFDFIGEKVGRADVQVVAIDLRGRGKSDTTPPGSYGWISHAKDAIAVADALGAQKFSILGQSMGGAVGMEVAKLAGHRLERLVLIDICGMPDQSTLPLIRAAVERLGTVYPSLEEYIGLVQALGTIVPWSEYWERYFAYELMPVEGGVTARTSRKAVLEDNDYGATDGFINADTGQPRVHELWSALKIPVLLLRGTRELMPGFGHIVPESERDAFMKAVPTAELVEVDANHYGINVAQESADAINDFLDPVRKRSSPD